MKLKCGYLVITGIDGHTSNPTFSIIKEILISNGSIILGLTELETIQFYPHYHSWVVKNSNSTTKNTLLNLENLYSHQILFSTCVPKFSSIYFFVALKYSLTIKKH